MPTMYRGTDRKLVRNRTGKTITVKDKKYGTFSLEPGDWPIPRDLYRRSWRLFGTDVVDLEVPGNAERFPLPGAEKPKEPKKASRKATKTASTEFDCPECGRHCGSKGLLTAHIRKAHDEGYGREPKADTDTDPDSGKLKSVGDEGPK